MWELGQARAPESWRLWLAALCVAPLSLAACGDDVAQTGPPQIVGLRFLDGCTLEVTFSDPMEQVEGIDPDIFRLSAAFYEGGVTTYYDLGIHLDGTPDETETPPKDIPTTAEAGRVPRHFVGAFIDIERDDDDPTIYRLLNNLDVTERGACEAVAEADDARLMLHYSDFWEPRVQDRTGEPLGDLGSHWVRSLGMKIEQGRYPFMPLDLPIPCPTGVANDHS